jgi:hypothetical protein
MDLPGRPSETNRVLDDLRVADALDEYVQALEAGCRPDREELLARFPGIRDPLAGYLDAIAPVAAAPVPFVPYQSGRAHQLAFRRRS